MNWVEWGDAPAWFALLLSGVAAFYAIKARGDSKRSADAAEQSARDGARAADAALRSAQADEAALQLQQAAAQPVVTLKIRHSAPGTYRLVNEGDATAPNIKIHPADQGKASWADAPGDLEPGDSREFLADTPANKPSRLRFTWDGHQEPVHVDWP